jgi:hypothetical protein
VTIIENGVIINMGTCASGVYTYTVPVRTAEYYQYDVYQSDATTKSSMTSFTWIKDSTAPSSPAITTPSVSSVTTAGLLLVAGTCNTGNEVNIMVDSIEDSSTVCVNGKFSSTISRSGNTSYTVKAVQKDLAQNLSADSNIITWTQSSASISMPIVSFPPNRELTSAEGSLNIVGQCTAGATVTISAGSGTSLSSGEITLPSGSFSQVCAANGSFIYKISKSTDGTYNFNLIQQAAGGGATSPSVPVEWSLDTTPPTVTLTQLSSNIYSSIAVFSFTSENGATHSCSVDNGAFVSCSSPYLVSTLTQGVSRTLTVKATDRAGNMSSGTTATSTPNPLYNTTHLYHFDANTASTVNSSLYNTVLVSPATVGTSATQTKFGTRSARLNSASPTGTIPDSLLTSTYLSSATIDFWVRLNAVATGKLIGQESASGFSWAISLSKLGTTTGIFFSGSVDGRTIQNVASTCNLSVNIQFHHIAVTFDKGTVSIYCNGINSGTGTIGIPGNTGLFDSSAPITLGSTFVASSATTFIDELRISQVVRYNSNFTPASSQYNAD